jgi:hypothetical protein
MNECPTNGCAIRLAALVVGVARTLPAQHSKKTLRGNRRPIDQAKIIVIVGGGSPGTTLGAS